MPEARTIFKYRLANHGDMQSIGVPGPVARVVHYGRDHDRTPAVWIEHRRPKPEDTIVDIRMRIVETGGSVPDESFVHAGTDVSQTAVDWLPLVVTHLYVERPYAKGFIS